MVLGSRHGLRLLRALSDGDGQALGARCRNPSGRSCLEAQGMACFRRMSRPNAPSESEDEVTLEPEAVKPVGPVDFGHRGVRCGRGRAAAALSVRCERRVERRGGQRRPPRRSSTPRCLGH